MKEFFNKYKVLIIGLLTSIALPVAEYLQSANETVSTKTIIVAVVTAAISWIANNLRGQWASIAGIVLGTLSTYLTADVTIHQLIGTLLIQLLAIFAPPAKSRGYEHTDIIVEAKKEGELIKPTLAPPQP